MPVGRADAADLAVHKGYPGVEGRPYRACWPPGHCPDQDPAGQRASTLTGRSVAAVADVTRRGPSPEVPLERGQRSIKV
jgi:hypothetical protein